MSVVIPRDWRGVRNRYQSSPDRVRSYFSEIPSLLENYSWEVSIAYAFLRLEQAHNYCLYAGVRRLHRAEATVASRFVDKHHLTRKGFQRLFKNVFGEALPAILVELIKDAEKVRDKVIHGKSSTASDHRKALISLLEYAIGLNKYIMDRAGFSPFVTDRRGLTGRGEALDRSTTSWLMRGLGFNNKQDEEKERA